MKENAIEKLNGKREPLGEKLPLQYPYSVSVTTANVCNLKCEYCGISENRNQRNKAFLELNTLKKAVDSMVRSHWKLKQMVLVGLGEPFLNKNIIDFVNYINN